VDYRALRPFTNPASIPATTRGIPDAEPDEVEVLL
jgi:hypothetical protein